MQVCMERRPEQMHKEGKKKNLFFWFMGLMGKRLPLYLLGIMASTLGMALRNIANAEIVETIVSAAQSKVVDGICMQVGVEFFFFVLSAFLWRAGIMQYNIEGKRGIAKLEKLVFSKAMRFPMSYYEEHHSGDFISKLIYDTERAGDIYGSRLRRLSAAVLSALLYLIPMYSYSPQLTGCLLLISILSVIVNSIFIKPMKGIGKRLAVQNGRMTEALTNILGGTELIKTFPIGRVWGMEYRTANKAACDMQKEGSRVSALLESFQCMFELLSALIFLGLGVWFVARKLVTLGELTAIYTLYGTFRYVFSDIGKYLPQMMECMANVERLYDFLQLEEEAESYTVENMVSTCEDAVVMENIRFSYSGDRVILKDFSMGIKSGTCVALVGESGCGKSTLAKLLLGFYPPEAGRIVVAGEGDTLASRRKLISYVPQEPYLYGVSIAENIAYGREGVFPEQVPMEDIIRAAKKANAHDFIMKLPEGYQTVPGERGNTLSGGERQRIAIARAVLRDAPIFLLDEATSALDNESEQLINQALDRVCEGRTTIMIAHRPSTIAMAEEVIVVG